MSDTLNTHDTILLPDWLRRASTQYPDRPALIASDEAWTFAELDRRANHVAQRLASAGISDGSRVALLAENSSAYAVVVHALRRLGAILVPLNTRLTGPELAWQLEDVHAVLLVSDSPEQLPDIAANLPALPHLSLYELTNDTATQVADTLAIPLHGEIDLATTQAIVYTSGTTGRPKGAIITHGMQWWSATASALNLGLRDNDRWLACLPFFHVGGLSLLMKSAIYGMPLIVFERFDAQAVNASIVRDRVTMISVVAVMLRRMLDALDAEQPSNEPARYPDALRCVLLGGGPAPLPLLEDCVRRGLLVSQTYGLTESCSQAATLAPADALRKLGAAGMPLLPVQLRIVTEKGAASPGEAGEIELRGPTITPGYDAQSKGTAATFDNGWFHDGWLRTGDLGYLDTDGYLYVLDRRSDLIVSGGENVYPAEIEAVLAAHPAVLEAGVRGIPDERWGQVPLAFAHLREGVTADEANLLAFLKQRLAKYKLPRAVRITGILPRNAAGKLLRRDLPDA